MTKDEYEYKIKIWCKKEYIANQGRYMFAVDANDALWHELCDAQSKNKWIHPQDIIEWYCWIDPIPGYDESNLDQAYIDGYQPFTQKFIDEVMS